MWEYQENEKNIREKKYIWKRKPSTVLKSIRMQPILYAGIHAKAQLDRKTKLS